MLTVRFPDGQALQYNRANTIDKTAFGWRLYERRDSEGKFHGWVADVPGSCMIEPRPACRVYNPLTQTGDMIGWLLDNMRGLSWSELGKLAELKMALKDFNAQRRTWK